MNKSITEKIANYIIIILFIIFSSLLAYNIYIIINRITLPKPVPKNSIRVSPISGENINVSTPLSITKVTYSESNISNLGYIENASILFENYSITTNQYEYSALFHNLSFKLHDSMRIITYEDTTTLPNISFLASSDLSNYGFSKNISSIDITHSKNSSYTIQYLDGFYYRSTNTKSPSILYDNIIVNDKNNNTTYVFSKGSMQQLTNPSSLTLSKGRTFYVTLSSKGSLSFR